jgi:glycine cleavage system aminomethyltransferase T
MLACTLQLSFVQRVPFNGAGTTAAMATISPSTTIRRSAYYASTVAEGVTSFSTYNHMLLPISYGDPQAEYRRLVDGVALWDVGCERQVEVAGNGAARLIRHWCRAGSTPCRPVRVSMPRCVTTEGC